MYLEGEGAREGFGGLGGEVWERRIGWMDCEASVHCSAVDVG